MMVKYGIQDQSAFTGKEHDVETGYGYFGARYMDHELMTMWLSVDPLADKYPSISSYAYCAWNPMKLVDPDGREIDVSALYDKSGKCKFKLIEKALMAFAKTKYGYKELSKYAKAGQEILGVKFDSDGEYHKKKMDLSFGGKPSKHYYNGDTDREIINCRLKIAINLSNVTDIKSIFETICHELFIHARQIAKDYDDNGVLDHSYLVPYLKKYVNDQGRTNGAYIHAEHAHFAWYDTEGQFLFIKTIGTQYPQMSNKEIIKMINEGFGNSSIKVKR
ncbi:MAG: RHS repeat-associated core domain-containing protein [Alphaproteobacteria bacterium]|nr:RHS repeat-associated core domain-containing protein [Alphaproteobacteria bacterium]